MMVLSPDCKVGKHDACNKDAWDMIEDVPAECECECHNDDMEKVIRRLFIRLGRAPREDEVTNFIFGTDKVREQIWNQNAS
jgi:hypothetical protein